MTPRYPGAIWRPTLQKSDGSFPGGLNGGPNTVSVHGAITTGDGEGIASWNESEYNHCHGFVERLGKAWQYVDFNYYVAGTLDGNYKGVVVWETWDGLVVRTATYDDVNRGADDRPEGTWTPEECERIADITAWDDVVLGIAARTVTSTRDRAHAVHGHGIRNRASLNGTNIYVGPDAWSTDSRKPCPGDKRIAQWPGIIARAQVIAAAVRAGRCTWLPVGDVDLASALARTGGTPVPTGGSWIDVLLGRS